MTAPHRDPRADAEGGLRVAFRAAFERELALSTQGATAEAALRAAAAELRERAATTERQ